MASDPTTKHVKVERDLTGRYWPDEYVERWQYKVRCQCKPGCWLVSRGGGGYRSAAEAIAALRGSRR